MYKKKYFLFFFIFWIENAPSFTTPTASTTCWIVDVANVEDIYIWYSSGTLEGEGEKSWQRLVSHLTYYLRFACVFVSLDKHERIGPFYFSSPVVVVVVGRFSMNKSIYFISRGRERKTIEFRIEIIIDVF